METIILLTVTPTIAAMVSIISRRLKLLRELVPALAWLQLFVVLKLLWPVLSGQIVTLQMTADFCLVRTSALFLTLTSFIVATSLTHALVYFRTEEANGKSGSSLDVGMFMACTCLFLLAMSFVFMSDNIGFMWISVEATTISSASLVYYSRTKHALEATWKYLIICSVGIAFALLGTGLIFASSQHGAIAHGSLSIRQLIANANLLQYPLLRLGFVFCFVGYGTKAGMFPLHSWLPDAHSEAPAPASAMLSGALLNCALFVIWQLTRIVVAAQHENLPYTLEIFVGTITVAAASLFLIRQHGIKRLWAYSSIENVGLMLVAIGLGSAPLFFLQALNHSLSKVALFLLSGNIIQLTNAKEIDQIRGLMSACPIWAFLFALAAFAVTGAPPFGSFMSEWIMLAQTAGSKMWWVFSVLIVSLAVSFVAVGIHVSHIIFGTPKPNLAPVSILPASLMPALLVLCTLIAGITALPLYLVTTR